MIEFIKAVRDRSSHRGSHLLVMLMLAERANDRGQACPSIDTLARDCRLGYRRVMTIVHELRDSGEIDILEGESEYGTNVYVIRPDRMTREGLPERKRRHPLNIGEQFRPTQIAPNPPVSVREEKDKIPCIEKTRCGGGGAILSIDRAASPRPPKQPAPQDPLMQARKKPESSAAAAGGSGPLFGEPEPVKAKTDEIVVREVFQLAYERKHGIKAKWGGAEAKHAKELMRAVRQGAEKRKANPEMVLARVVAAFLSDDDAFLAKNGYRFLLLSQRSPRYISEVLKLGSTNTGPKIRTGSW